MTGKNHPISIDSSGIDLPATLLTACDVHFDGRHVWSFDPAERRPSDGRRRVPWPTAMQPFLSGTTRVTIVSDGAEILSRELSFGNSDGPVEFVDKQGIPLMVDKWGLLQRPFSGRDPEVLATMVETTDRIMRVLESECGIRTWLAFGSLLGAARSGRAIGHDSDIDLAYLSDKPTPSEMAAEMFAMGRALRRDGMRVLNKSGSFITVTFPVPDGGQGSIDIYTCFYLGDLLHMTATVRAPVPRSAIEPLTTIEFEGHEFAAPADPPRMLTVSYGENWRVPDPSFAHRPGAEIKTRFDGWFGSLMRHRRDWERQARAGSDETPSPFARWMTDEVGDSAATVLEVGSGTGQDAVHFGRRGYTVVGLDYARGASAAANRTARAESLEVGFRQMNLYDLRDTLTMGAQLARRTPSPRVVYARSLLDALEPDGLENFWRFADQVLRGGGRAFVEFTGKPSSREDAPAGLRRLLDADTVGEQARRRGGVVTRADWLAPGAGRPGAWRMTIEWTK